jgi:hypothetical protein
VRAPCRRPLNVMCHATALVRMTGLPRWFARYRRVVWVVVCVWPLTVRSVSGQWHVGAGYQLQSWNDEQLKGFGGWTFRAAGTRGEVSLEVGFAEWSYNGDNCLYGIPSDPATCLFVPTRVRQQSFAVDWGYRVVSWDVAGGEVLGIPFLGIALAHFGEAPQGSGWAEVGDSWGVLELGAAARYRTSPLLWNHVRLFAELRGAIGMPLTSACQGCVDPLEGSAYRHSVVTGVTVGP